MLAPDVHVIAMSTNPALPHTDLTGAEDYMKGLAAFAEPVVAAACVNCPAWAITATRC